MPPGAQVAFAKSWLERQGIAAETIDVHSLIDRSLSYEENIKLLKELYGLGKRGMDAPMVVSGMTAAECDLAIGNYDEGYAIEMIEEACRCGQPDACEDLERLTWEHIPEVVHIVEKPAPEPRRVPAVKVVKPKPARRGAIRGSSLTSSQQKHLKKHGYVNVTRNYREYRITPGRVERGIIVK